MTGELEYAVYLDPRDDGGYRAWCPEFEACLVEGETWDEVLEAIGTAIAGRAHSTRFVLRPVSSVG